MKAVPEAKDDQRNAWQQIREKVSTFQRVTENIQRFRIEPQVGVAPAGVVDVAQEFFALLNGLVGTCVLPKGTFLPPPTQHGVAPEREPYSEERVAERGWEGEQETKETVEEEGALVVGSMQGSAVATRESSSDGEGGGDTEESGATEENKTTELSDDAEGELEERIKERGAVSLRGVNSARGDIQGEKEETPNQVLKGALPGEEVSQTSAPLTPDASREPAAVAKLPRAQEPGADAKEGVRAKHPQTIGQFDTVLPQEGQSESAQLSELKSAEPNHPTPSQPNAPLLALAQQTAAARGSAVSGDPSRLGSSGVERLGKSGVIVVDTQARHGAAPREFSLVQKLPPGMQAKIVNQIQKLLDTAKLNGNQMVVRLDPPQLGSVMLRLTVRGEQMYARLVPESREVETVLRERAQEIVQVLSGGGVKPENIHVNIGREPQEFHHFFEEREGRSRGERHFEDQVSTRHSERDWGGSQETPQESDRGAPGWVA